MRARFVAAVVLLILTGAAAGYAASAFGREQVATCSHVRVAGGNFNGLVGGTIVAAVVVRNVEARSCTINTRPWVRVGPVGHPVNVQDAPPRVFGTAGDPQRVLTLQPGQRAAAQVFIAPGSCSRARSVTYDLHARAGWAERSVPIGNIVCKDGSTILVGSFQR